ncbi:DUF1028 domain-containing protein [Halorussus lipolyticus]|uniref:DUF1028 domain-containing protein n=1 Tax=Halorussus lipolyticus TaxID=3034024 RepID=UPI0023E84B4E|nr:DUF1028 domain-containing protein [Halorussus sp. DT80]
MTFSICVREETDETDDGPVFGVGVATDAPAVGALAPYVGHHGVVSTQSFVNVRLGRRGVELLSDLPIDHALEGLLAVDDHSQNRQVHGLDARGNAFAFSGENCDGWFGHEVRDASGITAAGNMLTGEDTLSAAIEAYEAAEGDLVSRLIDALTAGREAGGDERGHSSAAVKVKAPKTEAYHDLRVDYHDEPISELRGVYEAAKDASEGFSEDSKGRIFD